MFWPLSASGQACAWIGDGVEYSFCSFATTDGANGASANDVMTSGSVPTVPSAPSTARMWCSVRYAHLSTGRTFGLGAAALSFGLGAFGAARGDSSPE